jgi:hypothetical protein
MLSLASNMNIFPLSNFKKYIHTSSFFLQLTKIKFHEPEKIKMVKDQQLFIFCTSTLQMRRHLRILNHRNFKVLALSIRQTACGISPLKENEKLTRVAF